MATPITEPAGAATTARMMASVEPVIVAHLDDLVRALGVHHHDAVGVLGTERVDVLGPEALVDRAVTLPQQEGGLLHLAVGQAAERLPRVPDPHVVGAVAELEAGVATEVLVGEEEDRVTPLEGPGRARPGHWTRCRPAPPWRPTKAFSAAAEFM